MIPSVGFRAGVAFAAGAGLAVLAGGCRAVEQTAQVPVRAISAVAPSSKSNRRLDPAILQAELQRFADDYAGRSAAALDDYGRVAGTAEAQHQALAWKVHLSSAVVNIASGPNPAANLLDLLALATITRISVEERATQDAPGSSFQLWRTTSRSLETEAWLLAEGVFSPAQQQELRDHIRAWWDAQSGVRATFFARPQEFASLIRETAQPSDKPGSVFALVGLDPTAGLDPAVREVTRTRLFAERAMYAVQRLPFLLRWQSELLALELLRKPELAALLADTTRLTASADRASRALESASLTAASLPNQLSAERKAILDAIEHQSASLRELSAEVGRTLAAGERMSASLHPTIAAFDALMKRFGVGEPQAAPPDTNSPPFRILEYARTAEQITLMAQRLDALIKDASGTLDAPALDKRIAQLQALAVRARADAKSVLNHAALLAAGAIGLALAAALVYRRVGRTSSNRDSLRSGG
jgi:hypothetical protein